MALWDDLGSLFEEWTLPEAVEAAVARGDLLLRQRNFAGALVAYRDGLQKEPGYAPLHVKAGVAAYFLGDQGEARQRLARALRLKPDLPAAEFWLGQSSLAEGRFDDAMAHLRRARRAGFAGATLDVAVAQAHLGAAEPRRAVEALGRVLERAPADAAALRLLCRALDELGEHRELHGRLREAERAGPLPLDVAGARALALARSGAPAEGRSLLEGLLRQAPDDGRIYAALGVALAEEGNLDGARGCLGRAVSLLPRAPLPAWRLAALYADDGRLAEALSLLSPAALAPPQPPELRAPADTPPEGEPFSFGVGGSRERLLGLGLRVFLLHRSSRPVEARAAAEALAGAAAPWVGPLRVLAGLDEPFRGARREGGQAALLDYACGVRSLGADAPAAAAAFREGLARLECEGREPAALPIPRTALVQALREGLRATGEQVVEAEVERRSDLKAEEGRLRGRFASLSEEVVSLLNRALVLLQSLPGAEDAARAAARLREDYDRPLLVSIMGEFNTGKSTFINAFIGEAVAPMGVVPTTATINYLKFGAEKGLRIVYRDGTVESRPVGDLAQYVDERAADRAALGRVEVVEILYPLEVLKSVNIVDTPGLNAPIPEHERTTREFLDRSDAVLWLFSATQAGKGSEREVLDVVKGHARKALGVVNKKDKVEPGELKEILEDLEKQFAGYFVHIGAVSARGALKARSEKDDAAGGAASGFPEFERVLSEDIFMRSRQIKDEAALGRLRALVSPVLARREEARMAARAREVALESLRERMELRRTEFGMTGAEDLRAALEERLPAAGQAAARDLRDLLTAHKGLLGTKLALSAEDGGAFERRLLEAARTLVEAAFDHALRSSLDAFEEELRGAWEDFLAPLVPAFPGAYRALARPWLQGAAEDLRERVASAVEQSLGGRLRGGRLAALAERLEDEEPERAERALGRELTRFLEASVAPAEGALSSWSGSFFGALERMGDEAGAAAREGLLEAEHRFYDPLEGLAAAALELAGRLERHGASSKEQRA